MRRLLYQQGDSIVGVRLSFTKYAEAIIWPQPKTVANPLTWAFDAGGQGLLFARLPDTDAPQPERVPVARPKIEPAPMLRLFAVVGNVDVLEAMRGLGQTHEEIGRRLGLSRPQTTIILNGQFRPSRDVVRRVLELARAA